MKYFFLLQFSISALSSFAQTELPTLPAEVVAFIPKGYEALDYKTGDLNGDKKQDAILILKVVGEDSLVEDEPPRPFLLLIRQADNKLKQVKRNDNLVMCRHCGGVFGDPYSDLEISRNGFSIHFYGGSSWRWAYEYSFSYKPAKKDWYLTKELQTNFNATDPNNTMKEIEVSELELGEVSLEKFSTNNEYTTEDWVVTSVKTYFYDNPKSGSKPRKGYLVKGNKAQVYRVLKNFVEASFENSKGDITTGFLLKKDLVKQ